MNDFTVTSEDRMEAIQRAMLAFMKTTPSFVLDEESGTYLTDYIMEHGLNRFDPASYHAAYNARESVKRDRENRMAEWQRGRAAYLRPSEEDKTQAIEDLKQRQPQQAPAPFTPSRQYTEAELDSMSSDVYRKVILGVMRLDDVQGNSGYVLKPALAPEGVRTGFRKPRLSLQARKLLGLDK